MPKLLQTFFLAVVLAVPQLGYAADLPVAYSVDSRDLKSAISGTDLTFALYSDGACTNLVHTETVEVDDLTIVKLKLVKPRGAIKPPRTTELRHTLTAIAPAEALYLEVNGPGITAIGTICQVQATGIPGPEGPEGPEGPAGPEGPQGPTTPDVSARVSNSTSSASVNSSGVVLQFDTELWDTSDLHGVANPSRLTAPVGGKYLIFAHVSWLAAASGGDRDVAIRHNGVNEIAAQTSSTPTNPPIDQSVNTVFDLAAGDWVEVVVRVEGNSQPVGVVPDKSPQFGMILLR